MSCMLFVSYGLISSVFKHFSACRIKYWKLFDLTGEWAHKRNQRDHLLENIYKNYKNEFAFSFRTVHWRFEDANVWSSSHFVWQQLLELKLSQERGRRRQTSKIDAQNKNIHKTCSRIKCRHAYWHSISLSRYVNIVKLRRLIFLIADKAINSQVDEYICLDSVIVSSFFLFFLQNLLLHRIGYASLCVSLWQMDNVRRIDQLKWLTSEHTSNQDKKKHRI